MGRRRYSREQWSSWIEQQPSSGLTIAEFCQSVGTQESSFYRWRTKLACEQAEGSGPTSADPAGADFVRLSVVGSAGVEIDLPCGAVVHVPSNETMIRQVLRVLMESGRDDQGLVGGAVC